MLPPPGFLQMEPWLCGFGACSSVHGSETPLSSIPSPRFSDRNFDATFLASSVLYLCCSSQLGFSPVGIWSALVPPALSAQLTTHQHIAFLFQFFSPERQN